MNSQQLLYINLGIGLFFVLYFLFFRSKPRPPTRLHLRGKPSDERQVVSIEVERQEREAKTAQVVQQVLTAKSATQVEILPEVDAKPSQEEPDPQVVAQARKDHSIYFVYNGHEWECHDVLGIPRGTSLKLATEKYQQLIKTSDPSTFPFYEAAFEAILKRKGAR